MIRLRNIGRDLTISRRPVWDCARQCRNAGLRGVIGDDRTHGPCRQRRRLTAAFKELAPEPWRSRIHTRTLGGYGDPVGPGMKNLRARAGKQKTAPRDHSKTLICLQIGAGEGIRTLDPNLGNVLGRFTPQHLFLSRSPLSPYGIRTFLAICRPRPILLLPNDFRFGASPLLPRAPPAIPGKQVCEQAWNTRAGSDHGEDYQTNGRHAATP